jgi:hypothetical protein
VCTLNANDLFFGKDSGFEVNYLTEVRSSFLKCLPLFNKPYFMGAEKRKEKKVFHQNLSIPKLSYTF